MAGSNSCYGLMPLCRPLYLSTRRYTQSDVMTIVTTTNILDPASSQFPLPLALRRSKTNYGLQKPPWRGLPPREEFSEEELRRLLNTERGTFMSGLGVKRDWRREEEKRSAEVLQRVVRGFLLRRWLKVNARKIKLKAKIQQSYGVINRQIKMKLELQEQAKLREEKQERACVAIQTFSRAFLSRRALRRERYLVKVHALKKAQIRIASIVRRFLAKRCLVLLKHRSSHELILKATIHIQSSYRAWQVRACKRHRQLTLHHVAAFVIQRSFRLRHAMKAVNLERHRSLERLRNLAAITIQSLARAHAAKQRISLAKAAAAALKRDANALCIQRVVRGWFGRRLFKLYLTMMQVGRRTAASIQIQRITRGRLGRVRAREALEEAEMDIFFQARRGEKQQVEDLHSLGLAIDATDQGGNTVLLVACKHGHAKIARKCLKWGMNINHLNDKGQSAVVLAVQNGHALLAESLIAKKAFVEKNGRCLLHDAAHQGFLEVVQALLHREVDALAVDTETGETAIHSALSADVNRVGHEQVQQLAGLLLGFKVPINAQDSNGNTPLHVAARSGILERVQFVVQAGADLSQVNNDGDTAWKLASTAGFDDCAQFLRAEWIKFTQQQQKQQESERKNTDSESETG